MSSINECILELARSSYYINNQISKYEDKFEHNLKVYYLKDILTDNCNIVNCVCKKLKIDLPPSTNPLAPPSTNPFDQFNTPLPPPPLPSQISLKPPQKSSNLEDEFNLELDNPFAVNPSTPNSPFYNSPSDPFAPPPPPKPKIIYDPGFDVRQPIEQSQELKGKDTPLSPNLLSFGPTSPVVPLVAKPVSGQQAKLKPPIVLHQGIPPTDPFGSMSNNPLFNPAIAVAKRKAKQTAKTHTYIPSSGLQPNKQPDITLEEQSPTIVPNDDESGSLLKKQFKAKYLKYKQKYLSLLALQNSRNL
jgi:hypothetical protein